MGNKDPTDEVVMDHIIGLIEKILFPRTREPRLGFEIRQTDDPIRMLGHVGLVGRVCTWFNLELRLGFDPLLIHEVAADHDMGDVVFPPKRRRGGLAGPLQDVIERFTEPGPTYKQRKKEFGVILPGLKDLQESTPVIWGNTESNLTAYFLRPKLQEDARGVAWLLHNTGKVLDVHLALWYARSGYMKLNSRNIRTLADRLRRRLRNKTASLYWERLKEWYSEELARIYRSSETRLLL